QPNASSVRRQIILIPCTCPHKMIPGDATREAPRYPSHRLEQERPMRLLILAVVVALPASLQAQSADRPLAPWGANRHPTDGAKQHVVEIAAGRHAYTVRQGGTMDGTNCRSPIGVGMSDGPAIQQTWESNRFVRLENIGETDVVNPWLSTGRNGFRTLDEIV